jgi:CMP-2-keto-3-deoxyoctulosonic acid synthetase
MIQSQVIENRKNMMENLVAANATLVGNITAMQDIESPNVVRVKSSMANRPG